MTYPTDDLGNPRVDFVWGNMAMQPDDQRDTVTSGPEVLIAGNIEGNRNWDATYKYPSEGLYASVTQYLSVGDQSMDVGWQNPTTRTVSVPADNHSVALTGYSNYPAYIPNYAGDGDTGLETVVPDLKNVAFANIQSTLANASLGFVQDSSFVGATLTNDGKYKTQNPAAGSTVNVDSSVFVTFFVAPTVPDLIGLDDPTAAESSLADVALVLGNTNGSTVGATSENNQKVKSQSIASGTKVNAGTAVDIVVYDYVAATTFPIAAVTNSGLAPGSAATDAWMYLMGRIDKPTVGWYINIDGNGLTAINDNNYQVISVEDDDAFNTGGTKVLIRSTTGDLPGGGWQGNNGTWNQL